MNCNFLIPFSSIQISYTFIHIKKDTLNVFNTIFIFTTFNFSRNFRNEEKNIKLNTSRINGNVSSQKLECIKFKMNLTATILIRSFFKKNAFFQKKGFSVWTRVKYTYICVFPKQLNLSFDFNEWFLQGIFMFPSRFLAYISYVSVPISDSYKSIISILIQVGVLVETEIRTRSWGRCLRYGYYFAFSYFTQFLLFVGAFL